MTKMYRKPRNIGGAVGGMVIGDANFAPSAPKRRVKITAYAAENKKAPTFAEQRFSRIVDVFDNGALRGTYHREWIFGKYIVDFYFWQVRLAVEIDGPYHNLVKQKIRDTEKRIALEKAGIILKRFTNAEVYGDKNILLRKFHAAFILANDLCGVIKSQPVVKRAGVPIAGLSSRQVSTATVNSGSPTKDAVTTLPKDPGSFARTSVINTNWDEYVKFSGKFKKF